MIFDIAFKYVVGEEGALSLDPDDRGNWTGGARGVGVLRGTKFGISAMAYPTMDIADLTLSAAKDIYQTDYWVPARCPVYSDSVALMVFDAAVNQGIQRAKEMLQEALGVRVDGEIGPSTLGALALANPHILIAEYRDVRIQHYRRDAEFDKFGAGWVKRANQTAQEAATLV